MSGRFEKHPGARGPPLEFGMERSAYLLCPGPEADRGQMRMHLPSSASSSPPGRRTIFLGSGLGVTGDGDGGGGGATSASICNLKINKSSLCSDKPGLPRSAARLNISRKKTTSPTFPDLARGKDGFAYNRTSRANPRGISPPGSASAKLGNTRCLKRVEQATHGE